MTDIPIRYVGTDSTGAASSSARRNIESVGKAASGAQGGVKGLNSVLDSMGPAGRAANAMLQEMQGGMSGLGSMAGVAKAAVGGLVAGAVIGGVVQLGKAIYDLGTAGAGLQEMRASFEGVAASAGMSASTIMQTMRRASEGMVSDAELVQRSNRALMMGAASNATQMAELMEIAKVRSDAVGMSVGEAFGSLAEGIGRVSERQLYALGINVDLEAANAQYAASLGKTADKLSDAEKRQALYNAVVADSKGLVEAAGGAGLSNADKLDQFAASWANLKDTMAQLVAGPMTSFVSLMNAGLTGIQETFAPEPIEAVNAALVDAKQNFTEVAAASKNAVTEEQFTAARQLMEVYKQQAALLRGELRTANAEAAAAQREYNDALARYDADPFSIDVGVLSALNFNLEQAKKRVDEARAAADSATYSYNNLQHAIDLTSQSFALQNAQLLVGGYGWAAQQESARRAAEVTEDSAARQQAALDALAAQYANVAPIQAYYAAQQEVARAAEEAGLSASQAAALTAQMSAQYDALTAHGYTAADAIAIVTSNANASIERLTAMAEQSALLTAALDDLAVAAANALTAFLGAASRIQAGIPSLMRQLSILWGSANNLPTPGGNDTGTIDKRRNAGRGGNTGMINTPTVGAPSAGLPQIPEMDQWWRKQIAANEKAAASTARMGGAAGDAASKLSDLSGKLQGMLDKVPGLGSPSSVTDEQLKLASLGVPQNFADDYLRQLTDEVMNGVDWAGVDIKDAASRAGIDPNLPAEAILEMFKNAWANKSLFANPANLDLINMDAVKANLLQQQQAATGKANLMALFGIGDESTVAAVSGLMLGVQQGLADWLSQNGFGEQGAAIAASLGAGVGSTDAVGVGAGDSLTTWVDSDNAASVAASVGATLGGLISKATVVTPTVNVPTVPTSPTTPTVPTGATLPAAAGPVVAATVAGALFSGAGAAAYGRAAPQVVVQTVINTPMDEARFARMLKDALRKATIRS